MSLHEIVEGLTAGQKSLSPKYFYDERGSELFDRICELPEYYPTRTERLIMNRHGHEIAEQVGPRAAVIEFGAGSNAKARQLLGLLESPVAYVPVEISGEYLESQCVELQSEFPDVSIKPVVADFTRPFELPQHTVEPERNLVFFPGSTIGNFVRPEARELLEVMRLEAKPGGALLIGVDLVKDIETLEAAYNDSAGVTAEFNRNALRHLNSSVGTDFEIESFEHRAIYDEEYDRIEMRLISLAEQKVNLAGEQIRFAEGEHIVTEYSHKYSIDSFRELARSAGWTHQSIWTDEQQMFSVHLLTAES